MNDPNSSSGLVTTAEAMLSEVVIPTTLIEKTYSRILEIAQAFSSTIIIII
jgi:hypothetical protein